MDDEDISSPSLALFSLDKTLFVSVRSSLVTKQYVADTIERDREVWHLVVSRQLPSDAGKTEHTIRAGWKHDWQSLWWRDYGK